MPRRSKATAPFPKEESPLAAPSEVTRAHGENQRFIDRNATADKEIVDLIIGKAGALARKFFNVKPDQLSEQFIRLCLRKGKKAFCAVEVNPGRPYLR